MNTDPVSGNPIPPGASAREVRDNVPIMASENEFVVPADVVRFLGLEKLEGLVNKAKESLAQMQQKGRIGGKPAPQQPPREAPMPLPQGGMPSQPMGGPPRPPGMAEGGVVAPTSQQAATGSPAPAMQAYEGPDGRMVYIPFVNGQPLTPIPAGYRPASAVRQAIQPDRGNRSGGSFFNAVGGMRANTPTSPQEWSVDEFINYGQQLQSGVPDAVTRGVGMILPFSNILFGLAERNMQNTVPGMIDNMIESGVDSQGNPLTDEQREGLLNTRNVMGERMAQERGDRFNPFESLSNLVGRLTGGSNQPSGQRQNNSMSTPSASQSRSSVAPTQAPASGSTPTNSMSGNVTMAPDKEEKDMGTKSFAYGGLVNKTPKAGFIRKPPVNQIQPTPKRRYEEGGLVRLPAIGTQPRQNADQPRGFLARELGEAANDPGRFNADVSVEHSYMREPEELLNHLDEFTSKMFDGTREERIAKLLRQLTLLENSPFAPQSTRDWDREDLDALRSRTGV